jgi:uncharacterized membrane-anchored protein
MMKWYLISIVILLLILVGYIIYRKWQDVMMRTAM